MPGDLEIGVEGPAFTIRLRVSPSARKARIVGPYGGALKISVVEPPESGKANAGMIALLAHALGLATAAVELISGHASRDKRVRVHGFPGTTAELKLRLAENSS